jgi:predicted nuclease with TOPRIM domain
MSEIDLDAISLLYDLDWRAINYFDCNFYEVEAGVFDKYRDAIPALIAECRRLQAKLDEVQAENKELSEMLEQIGEQRKAEFEHYRKRDDLEAENADLRSEVARYREALEKVDKNDHCPYGVYGQHHEDCGFKAVKEVLEERQCLK